MYEKLDEIPELLQVDEILVENQPTFINPTMKSVSAMLYSYFVMRGIHERVKTNSTIKDVSFCSPSNKIKVGGKKANDKLENAEEDKVYKVTKSLGVKFCKALISDNDSYLAMLNAHKKKDDLADAFLQGFIMNFQKLPEHYAEKIRTVDTDDGSEYEVNIEIHGKSTLDNGSDAVDEDIVIKIGRKKSSNAKDDKENTKASKVKRSGKRRVIRKTAKK